MRILVPFVTFLDKSTQWLYSLTGGHLGGQMFNQSMLILHTVGRKTGQTRTHTLLYLKDGDNMLIIASNVGQAHFPGWYWNLKGNPRARVQAGPRTYEVIAEEATGADYDRLWQRFKDTSLYNDHGKKLDRHIPIFILKSVAIEEHSSSTPIEDDSSPA